MLERYEEEYVWSDGLDFQVITNYGAAGVTAFVREFPHSVGVGESVDDAITSLVEAMLSYIRENPDFRCDPLPPDNNLGSFIIHVDDNGFIVVLKYVGNEN